MKRFVLVVGLTLVPLLVPTDALAQFGGVRGKVVDDDGNPIKDAAVVVETIGGQKFTLESRTGEDGTFHQVTTHTSGPWIVTITRDGYQPWRTVDPLRIPLGGDTLVLPTVTLARRATVSEVRSGQFKEATDLLVAADTALKAGDTAGAEARLDEAEAALQAFVEENPEEAGAYFNLGLIADRRQDWARASAHYLKAAELKPQMVDASVGAAAALINAQDSARAAEVLEKALADHPDNTSLRSLMALAQYNQGHMSEAAALYEQVRQATPGNPEPLYYLGMIAVQENRREDAIALLEEFLSLDPPDPASVETAKNLVGALKTQE
jgi:cytochrome c-type biogenesis protein CcmH/NrfG